MGHGVNLAQVLLGRVGSLWIIGLYRFFRKAVSLARKNGIPFLVKRMKAEQMLLMQYCAGNRGTKPLDGQKIRLNKSGLPIVIPPIHRHLIKKGDRNVIQFWMTVLGFYRVLEYPGVPKFSTITEPGVDVSSFHLEWVESLQLSLLLLKKQLKLDELLDAKAPVFNVQQTLNTLVQRVISLPISLFPIFKSGPTVRSVSEMKRDGTYHGSKVLGYTSHSWESIVLSAKILATSEIWLDFLAYAELTGNAWFAKALQVVTTFTLPALPLGEYPKWIGRLALKQEPAGKVRVFAMLDPWTQWLMAPLHKALYALFRMIPQDGTHDQTKPLKALLAELKARGDTDLYSFDLSAATDRVPLSIQVTVLNLMVGSGLGDLWGRILVNRDFSVPLVARKFVANAETLRYAVGQPMGAYSSWGMLNMTHHLVVQMAYHRAFRVSNPECAPSHWFPLYAVLGDDVVIGDRYVADHYLQIMKELGVEVNLTKSLISHNGSAEFAKRFIFNFEDVSPLSWKEFAVAKQSIDVAMELCSKIAQWRKVTVATLLDLNGKGYRAKSRITSHIDSLPQTLQGFVLQWLIAFNGFNLSTILQKTLYGSSLVEIDRSAIAKGLYTFIDDSYKSFMARCGPRLFESNGIARLGETLVVPSGNSPTHRFIFRLRFIAALWSSVYQMSTEGCKAAFEINDLVNRMKIRDGLDRSRGVWYVDTASVDRLVQLWTTLDDYSALIPRDLRHRVITEKLAMRATKKVRFVQTLRRKTNSNHKKSK